MHNAIESDNIISMIFLENKQVNRLVNILNFCVVKSIKIVVSKLHKIKLKILFVFI